MHTVGRWLALACLLLAPGCTIHMHYHRHAAPREVVTEDDHALTDDWIQGAVEDAFR